MSNLFGLFMRHGSLLLFTGMFSFFALTASAEPVDPAFVQAPAQAGNFAAQNYERLRAELPYYQEAANHPASYPWPVIPSGGKVLHYGVRDGIVLLLRQRLKTTHDLTPTSHNSTYFDEELADAVKVFQARHGLTADGVVGENTLNALNVPVASRLKQIQLNMQRWAQLAQDAGSRFVMVNIPEYRLHLIDNDSEALSMKVVVGRPTRQTPELASEITRIIFNPHWNVPHLIAQNDIVPKVIENGSYLNTNRIRIYNSQEEGAYEMSANDINWQAAEENGFQYHFRQDPGVRNALGLVKFEFQNTHDVYLHDTPAKGLFERDKRDFSSGCIRLEKPFALVAYLTQNDSHMDSMKVRETLEKRRTTYFRVDSPMPIYTTYITAWVDNSGVVHFAEDVYDKDMDPALATPQDDTNGEHKG